ncbi:MAG: hypothetical protein HY650_12240 [Acidobacteria bacterium]|nr:hypothetical protein [Acidobacteriota bacterium]
MNYRRKLDEVKKALSEKARELDARYGVTEKVDQVSSSAGEAFERARSTAARHVQSAREEFERFDAGRDVADRAQQTTEDFAKRARRSAKAAEEKLTEVLGEAEKYYQRVEEASGAAGKTVGAGQSIKEAAEKARRWVKQHPEKIAVISLSVIGGGRLGSAWTATDAVVLGAGGAGNWVFHSALAPVALQKLVEKYSEYLKKQELLVAAGLMTDAEAHRVHFQRRLVRYAGAPLLGSFNIAAGTVLIIQSVSGGAVGGAPLSWIIGGNPLLSSVWLFANGVICIHSGYKILLLAIKDDTETMEIWEGLRFRRALPAKAMS